MVYTSIKVPGIVYINVPGRSLSDDSNYYYVSWYYIIQLCGFKPHRVHTRKEFFLHTKFIGGKREILNESVS